LGTWDQINNFTTFRMVTDDAVTANDSINYAIVRGITQPTLDTLNEA
jgi:hypothetical protein